MGQGHFVFKTGQCFVITDLQTGSEGDEWGAVIHGVSNSATEASAALSPEYHKRPRNHEEKSTIVVNVVNHDYHRRKLGDKSCQYCGNEDGCVRLRSHLVWIVISGKWRIKGLIEFVHVLHHVFDG